MASVIRSRRRSSKASGPSKGKFLHRPNGVLSPRVEKVGPQRFGIVCCDCHKGCSKWMLCDFYGKVLIEPQEVQHTRGHFQAALAELQQARQQHRLKDLIVVVERTGNYHVPVQRAFAHAGYEVRIVHPYTTKQLRQSANPGNKTDDTDLAALFRAAITGFGLLEPTLEGSWLTLRLLVRHRRDLVQKRTALCCQIREHLDLALPGYAALFDDLWGNPAALELARRFPSPEALQAAGYVGLQQALREVQMRFLGKTLDRVLAWTQTAHDPAPAASIHHRVWTALVADYQEKTKQIQALERELALLLCDTPYVLLLSHPGINVVSAAELAGEMGPITDYAGPKSITGRAGLFPSRYQSHRTDFADGRIIRCANRRLRAALMMVADNLIKCNVYFGGKAQVWKLQGREARDIRVRVAGRFTRVLFQIVAGRRVFAHPSCRERGYILQKLVEFHQEANTPPEAMMACLTAAAAQLPPQARAAEAAPLQTLLERCERARRPGVKKLGSLLPLVLARLGVGQVQSTTED
jgi:transposase